MSRSLPWVLAACAVLGLVLAGYLFVHHIEGGAPGSLCNINATWNCDAVNTSRWSEIAGIPIALLGLGYFATMGFLGVRLAMGAAPRAAAVMTLLAGVAVAYDAFLGWAMLQIGSYCVLCISTWVLNAGLLAGSAWLATRQGVPFGAALGESVRGEGGNSAIVGLLTIVLAGMVFREEAPEVRPLDNGGSVEDLSHFYEKATGTIEVDGTEPIFGDPAAPYTMVEWADFECPHCAIMYKELHEVIEQNKDVKLLYKNYPISQVCNRFVEGERHGNACQAAAAGECARQQGRFWEVAEQMFKNQEYLGKDDIRFMTEKQGLDAAAFEACMADPATAESVRIDVDAGGLAGVQGTPSIYLKGPFGDQWVRLTGGRDPINEILAAARNGVKLPAPQPPREEPG